MGILGLNIPTKEIASSAQQAAPGWSDVGSVPAEYTRAVAKSQPMAVANVLNLADGAQLSSGLNRSPGNVAGNAGMGLVSLQGGPDSMFKQAEQTFLGNLAALLSGK